MSAIHKRLFRHLTGRFGLADRVRLLLSSDDEEIGSYLAAVDALGSTDMNSEGTIYIKIDDQRTRSKWVLLEEYAHALQFVRDGAIPLSYDSAERDELEYEVAECMLRTRGDRLPDEERRHFEQAVASYRSSQ